MPNLWRKLSQGQKEFLLKEGFDPSRRGSGVRIKALANRFNTTFESKWRPHEVRQMLAEVTRSGSNGNDNGNGDNNGNGNGRVKSKSKSRFYTRAHQLVSGGAR